MTMVTVLEVFSNEVIMQSFEYLDAYHIYQAFSKLNSRFNRLLQDHRLCFKFHSKHVREIDTELCRTMVNYLTAVTLINDRHVRMFMSACAESDLTNLHALTLRQVRISRNKASAVKFISKLKALKHLRIQAVGEIHELISMIFCKIELPELKSFECINLEHQTNVLFTWPQPTNIENLTVDCTLYCLSNLLLQTPKLKYLKVKLTNFGPCDSTATSLPLPMMLHLTELIMEIHFLSYIHLFDLMKSMPHLKSLELSGSTIGKNIDSGHRLKEVFGHLQVVVLDNLKCLTSGSTVNTILSTFNEDFWSDVTCSIEYDRACLSAFGHSKNKISVI